MIFLIITVLVISGFINVKMGQVRPLIGDEIPIWVLIGKIELIIALYLGIITGIYYIP